MIIFGNYSFEGSQSWAALIG